MATFTTTIQELIESDFDFGLTEQDYPIFDERYRGVKNDNGRWDYVREEDGKWYGLNRKILDRFMFYEIGTETADMFRHNLNTRMREIMPYYNQLYLTEAMITDPFSTMELKHTTDSDISIAGEEHASAATDGTNASTGKSRAVNSSTPQTMLSTGGDYASSATDSFTESTATNDGRTRSDGITNQRTEGKIVLDISGSQGSKSRLLQQYRESIINVDLMILNDLEPLFMWVMDTTDEFARRNNNYGYAANYFGFYPYL